MKRTRRIFALLAGGLSIAMPLQVIAQTEPRDSSKPADGMYHWTDVTVGEHVVLQQALLDRGGYRLVSMEGDTIVVPFVNQDLAVMKFARSDKPESYFVNDGTAPVVFVAEGAYLESSAAGNTRWYPLTQNFTSSRPVYVTVAPNWNAFAGMGWYPGMQVFGGMYSYNRVGYASMPGYYVDVNGNRFPSYSAYYNYYLAHPGYATSQIVQYTRAATPWRGSVAPVVRPAVPTTPAPAKPGVSPPALIGRPGAAQGTANRTGTQAWTNRGSRAAGVPGTASKPGNIQAGNRPAAGASVNRGPANVLRPNIGGAFAGRTGPPGIPLTKAKVAPAIKKGVVVKK